MAITALAKAVVGNMRRRFRRMLAGPLRISRSQEEVASVEVGGVIARCHRGWPEDGIDEAWGHLVRRLPGTTTFHSTTWQRDGIAMWIPTGALRVIRVLKGDELIALLPLERSASGFLDSAGHCLSDYLDPLVDPAHEEAAWRAVLTLLREQWDHETRGVTLHNIRAGATCRGTLKRIASVVGFVCEEIETGNAARIALPRSWDEYLASLDGHERKELKRKVRKIEGHAGACVRVSDARTFEQEHLDQVLDLVEMAGGEKAVWFGDVVRPVLLCVAEPLARQGKLRLLTLMIDGVPAAGLIELPTEQGPLMYNGGFDPAMKPWSPGIVLFALAIRRAIEEGATVFDLLRGREEYKYRLGARDEPLYRIALRPA